MSRIATTLLASLALAAAIPGFAFASDAESVLSGDLSAMELAPGAVTDFAGGLVTDTEKTGEAAKDNAKDPGALTADDLKGIAGGQNINEAITNQELVAQSTDNTIVTGGDFVTGNVSIGSFTGFNGVGVFVVNTGANSTLQGSIGVTVAPTQ
jgi:hypothetical protein